MRIAIVGAGAIGCLFGSRLHRAGHSVLLIHHDRRIAASIKNKGVRLRELSGRVVRAYIETKSGLTRHDSPELVMVTVKAYDTEEVASLIEKSVAPKVPVLSLQNGLGSVENLQNHLGSDSIIAGTTTEGAVTTGPGEVVHTGSGMTWVGETNGMVSERCHIIEMAFRRAGFSTIITKGIQGVLWTKAIVNSAINPISALTRVRNGDLQKTPELREVALEIIGEGSAVARANGILLKPSPKSLLQKILASTPTNKSSMLQDIEAGRKTEIRQLNGMISRLGGAVGVSTPLNDILAKLVLGLEVSQSQF